MLFSVRQLQAAAFLAAFMFSGTVLAQTRSADDIAKMLKAREAQRRGGAPSPSSTPSTPSTPTRPAPSVPRQPSTPRPMQPVTTSPTNTESTIEEFKRVRPELRKLSEISTALSETSQDRYDTIQMIIYNTIYDDNADIEKISVVKSIYDKIEKTVPVTPTEALQDMTIEELGKQAKRKTVEKYPESVKSLEDRTAKEAAAKYPMEKLRNKVSVSYKRGSQYYTVNDVLYRINPTNILVGDSTISFIDMPDEVRSRFDKDANEKLRNEMVKAKSAEYDKLRKDYAVKMFDELKKQQHALNEKNGYIFIESTNRWLAAKTLADTIIEAEQKKMKKYKEYLAKVAEAQKVEKERIAAEAAARNATFEHDEEIKVDVSEETYKDVVELAHKQFNKVNSTLSGIDADQGYKLAFWGAKRIDVHTLLSREPEFQFMQGRLGSDIIIMEEGRKPQSIELFYKDGKLYSTKVIMGNLSKNEFDNYKNSIHNKSGRSDEENEKPEEPIFKQILTGDYVQEHETPEETTEEEAKPDIPAALRGRMGSQANTDVNKMPLYIFHWTGKTSKAVLEFRYDATSGKYYDVVLTKECDLGKLPPIVEN